MKSLKIKLLVCLLFGISLSVKSQNLETIKVYYDYAKTRVKEVYTVKKNSGIKEGIYKFYDEDRMLISEIPYINNMKNGTEKMYCTAGSASLENKPMYFYGKLEHTRTYKDDQLDGSSKTYNYETGKQILKFDRIWSKGELIKSTEYYPNGNKKELNQKNGLNGAWYENGGKVVEYTGVDGIEIGIHTEWWKNGKMSVQTNYNKNGKEDGIRKNWDENGSLTETLYKNGVDVENEKTKNETRLKGENEDNDRRKKEQDAIRLQNEAKLAEKKSKQEQEQKIELIDSRIRSTNDKAQQVEKLYVVIDDIQTSLFGKEIYKTKKKNLYNAYTILRNDLSGKLNSSKNIDERLLLTENLVNLLNKVSDYSEQNTRDLEKELKGVEDAQKIKEIFNL